MKTILVVDDEFAIAEAISALLTDEGYRVFTAVNGRQALQRLPEVNPDLIVLDFMMPILDGPGMLRAMLEDPRYEDVPVIMMSGVAEASVREYCTSYFAFLRKPFDALALLSSVKRGVATAPREGFR
jgi:CheY-like chemotaxis protein